MRNLSKKEKKGFLKLNHSIAGEILRLVVIFVIIYTVILISAIFNRVYSTLQVEEKNILEFENTTNSGRIESWVKDILTTLNSVQNTLSSIDLSSEDELTYLKSTLNLDPNYPSGVYIGESNGNFIDPSGWKPDKGYVVTERDWYIDGLDHDTFQFGDAYLDEMNHNYVVSVSARLNSKDGVDRVASIDIGLDGLSEDLKEMNANKSTAFIMDRKSKAILAHPDADMTSKSVSLDSDNALLAGIANFMEKSSEMQNNGSVDATASVTVKSDESWGTQDAASDVVSQVFAGTIKIGSEKYLIYVDDVEGTNWSFVSYAPLNSIMSKLNDITFYVNGIVALGLLLISIILILAIQRIMKPFKKITKAIGNMTEGDFSLSVKTKGNDEIARLGSGLQDFIDWMRTVIFELNTISDQLLQHSRNSKEQADHLLDSANSQSDSMQQLNVTVEEFAKSAEEIAENATSLVGIVTDTYNKGEKVNTEIIDTVNISEQGRVDMDRVNKSMKAVEKSIVELKNTVDEVGGSTKEIAEMLKIINDIADQTNLVSLNASIEAARAGEAGKGFAVVADEIRNLANRSSNSAKDIAGIVEKITMLINTTSVKTEKTVSSIKESSVMVSSASKTFGTIYDKINTANHGVNDIVNSVKHLTDIADSVAAITEEQSAGTQEILAASEAIASESEGVANNSKLAENNSNELYHLSEKIKQNMSIFKA
jgi:methyl-accepting chemotaxis protein